MPLHTLAEYQDPRTGQVATVAFETAPVTRALTRLIVANHASVPVEISLGAPGWPRRAFQVAAGETVARLVPAGLVMVDDDRGVEGIDYPRLRPELRLRMPEGMRIEVRWGIGM